MDFRVVALVFLVSLLLSFRVTNVQSSDGEAIISELSIRCHCRSTFIEWKMFENKTRNLLNHQKKLAGLDLENTK